MRKIIIMSYITISYLICNSNVFSKQNIGINNHNSLFIKKLAQQFKLTENIRKIKITNKGKSTNFYNLKEYINKDSQLMVWFQKDWKEPIGELITDIYILSSSKEKLMEIAGYFISSLGTEKKLKDRWNKNLTELSFQPQPLKFQEKGAIPNMRCLSHKIHKADQNKDVFYLELSIVD